MLEENWDDDWDDLRTEEEKERDAEIKRERERMQEFENEELFESVGRKIWVNEFRNVKMLGPLAPIRFFTTLFILKDLAHCFEEHIFDLHVDHNKSKYKSKFVNLYNDKYIPFDLCCITFLLPDFTKLSRRHVFGNLWTYVVILKFFPSKVGWYCDKLGNQYESHWVKGVFCMSGESIRIVTCYPMATHDWERSLHPPDFVDFDRNFKPSFDYVEFCKRDYAIKDTNKEQFNFDFS